MDVIIGRQGSHYTRMVRMLAIELGLEVGLDPIYDLLSEDPSVFGGNPALKLPALRQGQTVVWGSQNACRALARSLPEGEARVFWAEDARSALLMNTHEIVAHTMAVQVEVVFHEVVSRRPPDAASRKRRASLENCLAWLESQWPAIQAELPADRILLVELGLFAVLEHFSFRNPMDLTAMPRLRAFMASFGQRPSAQRTPYVVDQRPG
ncbi:glutathione S-transferase family protein [Arenimonas sp. MALMAid1274]|uniref:glutathione S-transferase family protein n=1 Tax=Arenimonas sp. MALMAid1274 TaxID=3411630 RepID=UPI003B9E07CA